MKIELLNPDYPGLSLSLKWQRIVDHLPLTNINIHTLNKLTLHNRCYFVPYEQRVDILDSEIFRIQNFRFGTPRQQLVFL